MDFQPNFSLDETIAQPNKNEQKSITSIMYNDCMIDEPFNASLVSHFSKSVLFDEQHLVSSYETFMSFRGKLCDDFYRYVSFFVEQFENIGINIIKNLVHGSVIQITYKQNPNMFRFCELIPILTEEQKFGFLLLSVVHFDAFGRKNKQNKPDTVIFTEIHQFQNIFKHHCVFYSNVPKYYMQLSAFFKKNRKLNDSYNMAYIQQRSVVQSFSSLSLFDVDEEYFYKNKYLRLNLSDDGVICCLQINLLNGQIKMSLEHQKIQEHIIFNSFDDMTENNIYNTKIDEFIQKTKTIP